MAKVKAVLFDLGGTLIEYAGSYAKWPDLEMPGFTAAYQYLNQNGRNLPEFERFKAEGFALLPERWQRATEGVQNLRLADFLGDLLQQFGVTNLSSIMIREAAERYQAAICSQAEPMPGARDVLNKVKAGGYKIGLLSNTMFTGAAHEADLRQFDMIDYFDTLLFSADVNKWKPNPAPFWHVLEALGVAVDAAVFVGDDPGGDIVGGQRAGMRTIYFQSSQRFVLPDDVRPDAQIKHLSQLIPILFHWQQN